MKTKQIHLFYLSFLLMIFVMSCGKDEVPSSDSNTDNGTNTTGKQCQLVSFSTENATPGQELNETFEYDTQKKLIKRTSKNGSSLDTKITFKYDNEGFLIESIWERTDVVNKSNNRKRVNTYSYKNGKLSQINTTQTEYGLTTPKSGNTTYEYESDTSNKLKKVISYDVVTGNKTPYTFLFTNGILSSLTEPYNYTKTINSMGLVTKEVSQTGEITGVYNYNENGQPIKYDYFSSKGYELSYTIIKNKYGAGGIRSLAYGQYIPKDFLLAEGSESVFNPNGFKGFPSFEPYLSDKDKDTFLLKSFKSGVDGKTTTYDYKVDSNGNVTSFTTPGGDSFGVTKGTFTYKCE